MDKVRDIFSYFVAALTMFAFLGAVYQAFQNEKGSAVTLGTLVSDDHAPNGILSPADAGQSESD